jgi:hypothetical protein
MRDYNKTCHKYGGINMKSNKKKSQQLEMPHGTANGRLRKSILFMLIKECNKDYCFQCGAQILEEKDLSIEHKIPWLDSETPRELFFDLENIAFSHLKCNVGAARNTRKKYFTEEEKRLAKNKRCREYRKRLSEEERQKRRKEKYIRTGN